ncbi:RagB/SusD family nutrient uptake outer membrane protein [Candidatus Micrarchaeota archaeon]|nr:RagB/SusD family nutrient uptake outer membrane protein [Candidatus Micrarchaeota archaeon]MBU1930017.1 RagB/SusD family nutrient uptake outer membrane protein [Candidatus Micrarchaeota archaeon]
MHKKNPISLEEVKDKIFSFSNKPNARIYHVPPTRCFLVHNINGKWLYWGKIFMLEQTIHTEKEGSPTTSGKYKIIALYDPVYQEQITKHECNPGQSYF